MKGKCIICNCEFVQLPLMNLNNMVASAQNIPSEDEIANDHGIHLELYQCKYCGLVQFDCEPVNYYKKVIRAGGGSSTMINLRREQYADFIDKFNLSEKKILEVGCGQGEFLSILTEFNVEASGIEYSQVLVEKAKKKGLNVHCTFIDNSNHIVLGAPYDAFVQFNFLEHQPFPNEMLQGIYNNLTEDGVGLVTVPSLEYILHYGSYYELIRDHIAYYSQETLRLLFEKNGFEVLASTIINRDTHSIYVKKRKNIDISNWKTNLLSLKKELHAYINIKIESGKKVAVWGASHQSFTIISTLELGDKITYIIDSAAFKQGKFSPTSHVPIVSPEYCIKNPVDVIIIMAPGYSDEIISIIRSRINDNIEIATLTSRKLEQIQ